MPKRIAVLTRDRQSEALRMALGLLLLDDIPDIYVMDKKVEANEENRPNLEMFSEMDVKTYTNCRDNKEIEYLSTDEIAKRLLDYDIVIPY